MSRVFINRNRRIPAMLGAVTTALAVLGTCFAVARGGPPYAGPSEWSAATSASAEPAVSPRDTPADPPRLPPLRNAAAETPEASLSQLFRDEPLLESMLYLHSSSRPAGDGPAAGGAAHHPSASGNSTGLLGEMLQLHDGRPSGAAPAPASAATGGFPVAPADFQDEFDLFQLPPDDPPPLPPGGLVEQPDPFPELPAPDEEPPPAEPPTLGEAPPEDDSLLQFLRTQTILLDPGEHQIDVTLQYLLNTREFTFAQLDEQDELQLITLRRRQRLLMMPIELRYGLTCTTQGFINVPFGWSSDQIVFGPQSDTTDTVGIGDVSFGITELLCEGRGRHADVLATLAVTAPTGQASLAASLAVPESNLGSGFWAFTAALTFIRTYDPVVVFYGIGYQHRLDNTFAGGFDVNPGEIITYRLGVGFAINPQVTLSAAFNGAYITETKINGVVIPGSDLEPMSLRFAATIARDTCHGPCHSIKTVEPFANIGMTNEAVDALIGISWTF